MSHLPERQEGPMIPKAQQYQSLNHLSILTPARFLENPVCVAIWWAKCRNTHSLNSEDRSQDPKAAPGQAHTSESKSLILLPKHTH